MRFLILLPVQPFPADTGQRHRYAHLALYLAKHHEVALAYFTDPAQADTSHQFARHFVEVVPITEHGRPPSAWQRLSSDPSEVYLYRSEPLRAAVDRIVRKLSPDVLISGEPALSQYLEPYPGCVRVLDYICEATLQFERMRQLATGPDKWLWALRKMKYAAFLRRIAAVHDLCIVNSLEDRQALQAAAPEWRHVELIPNGLDLEAYPLNLGPPQPDTLIYPGSIGYEPNRDAVEFMARDILPLIRAQVPAARFRVTGKIPAGVTLPQSAGLEFTGYVPDVKPVIAGSWVCTVPLRLGAGGTRFKVLEALALGSALVSTAIGYEGVGVTDGVDVLMAEDAATFAARCVAVLQSSQLRQTLAAGGRRLVEEKYNWATLGRRLVGLVEELAARTPARVPNRAGAARPA